MLATWCPQARLARDVKTSRSCHLLTPIHISLHLSERHEQLGNLDQAMVLHERTVTPTIEPCRSHALLINYNMFYVIF